MRDLKHERQYIVTCYTLTKIFNSRWTFCSEILTDQFISPWHWLVLTEVPFDVRNPLINLRGWDNFKLLEGHVLFAARSKSNWSCGHIAEWTWSSAIYVKAADLVEMFEIQCQNMVAAFWCPNNCINKFCGKRGRSNIRVPSFNSSFFLFSCFLYLFLVETMLNLGEPFVKSLNLGCRIFPSLKFNVTIWLQLFGMQTIVEINHPSARHQTWRNSPLHWPQNVWWFSPGWQAMSSTITVER